MNVFTFGSRLLRRTSPIGVILGSAALVLAFPPVRQGLRTAAVAATRGLFSITDEAKRITSSSRENMQSIIEEAQNEDTCCPSCSDFAENVAGIKKQPRRLAVAATMGVLSVSDKAKSLYQDASNQLRNIVEEAKVNQASSDDPETSAEKTVDYHNYIESDEPEPAKH